jgi:hypothetical protein
MIAKLEVGRLLEETGQVVMRTAGGSLLYAAALGAVGAAIDLWGTERASNAPYTLTSIIGGYFLLRAMLEREGIIGPDARQRLGAYFGLSLLAGLGIVCGFVLLIIPGVILFIRWQLAFAILLAEDRTISAALSESWDMTEGQFWPLLGAMLVLLLVILLAAAAFVIPELAPAVPEEVSIILGNMFLSVFSVLSTAFGVAAYRLLAKPLGELEEVFA